MRTSEKLVLGAVGLHATRKVILGAAVIAALSGWGAPALTEKATALMDRHFDDVYAAQERQYADDLRKRKADAARQREELKDSSRRAANLFADCSALYTVIGEGLRRESPDTSKYLIELGYGAWAAGLYVLAETEAVLGNPQPLGYFEPMLKGRRDTEMNRIKSLVALEKLDVIKRQADKCNAIQPQQAEYVKAIREGGMS